MRYWVFVIASDPTLGSGWIRAETAEDALALVAHEDANVYPVPTIAAFPNMRSGRSHGSTGPEPLELTLAVIGALSPGWHAAEASGQPSPWVSNR